MKLEWSRFALADRDEIFDFIEVENPRAGIVVDLRVERATDLLVSFPEAGRLGRVAGTRELVISRTPLIAVYRIDLTTVTILRLIHGARSWPNAMPD